MEASETFTPEPAASPTIEDGTTYSHHFLSDRAVACGKKVRYYDTIRALENFPDHAEQTIAEKKTLVDSSTQTAAIGNSGDCLLSGTQTGKRSRADASTQTDEDVVVNGNSSDTSPTTLVNTPTDRLSLIDAGDDEHQDATASEDFLLEAQDEEEQMQEPQFVDQEIQIAEQVAIDVAAAGSTLVEESLTAEKAAHERTREEFTQLKDEIKVKHSQLKTNQNLIGKVTRSRDRLKGREHNLQIQLNAANLRISEYADSDRRRRSRTTALQSQVEELILERDEADSRIWELEDSNRKLISALVYQHNKLRNETKELTLFIRLGVKLYTRLSKAEKVLKGALGRADGLMRLAEQRLPIRASPETYLMETLDGDLIDTDDHQPKVQLAIEGPPAHFSLAQNADTVSKYEGALGEVDTVRSLSDTVDKQEDKAVGNGKFLGVEAGGPTLNNTNCPNAEDMASPVAPTATSEGSPKESAFTFSIGTPAKENEIENTAKKPLFAFGGFPAQGFRQEVKSTASTGGKENTTKKIKTTKIKTASIFDAAASVNLSSPSVSNKTAFAETFSQDATTSALETPKLTFTGNFNICDLAVKEPIPETETPLLLGAGTSTPFCFSPDDVAPTFGGFSRAPKKVARSVMESSAVANSATTGEGETSSNLTAAGLPT